MGFSVREVQETPNPNARKLLLDRTISESPKSYRSAGAAAGDEVGKALMDLPGVTAVLLLHDFVTINKSPEARWADITSKAKRILAKAGE